MNMVKIKIAIVCFFVAQCAELSAYTSDNRHTIQADETFDDSSNADALEMNTDFGGATKLPQKAALDSDPFDDSLSEQPSLLASVTSDPSMGLNSSSDVDLEGLNNNAGMAADPSMGLNSGSEYNLEGMNGGLNNNMNTNATLQDYANLRKNIEDLSTKLNIYLQEFDDVMEKKRQAALVKFKKGFDEGFNNANLVKFKKGFDDKFNSTKAKTAKKLQDGAAYMNTFKNSIDMLSNKEVQELNQMFEKLKGKKISFILETIENYIRQYSTNN